MSHPDIVRLALGEIDGPITVCNMPEAIALALNVSTRCILLSKATLKKQFEHHPEFRIHHVDDFEWMILNGEAYLHRTRPVAYFICPYRTEFGHPYKITVKATRRRHELWLTSAHPSDSLHKLHRKAEPFYP